MMADCFDLKLDDVKFSYELGVCTKDVDLGWYQLPKGSLGANYIRTPITTAAGPTTISVAPGNCYCADAKSTR